MNKYLMAIRQGLADGYKRGIEREAEICEGLASRLIKRAESRRNELQKLNSVPDPIALPSLQD